MNSILISIIVLGGTGILCAAILYFVARRFYVEEDPRIALVEELLPGANCGGCGRSGCHDFACACVSATTLDGLNCPGAGEEAMRKIGEIVGLASVASKPMVAVLRCNGSCENRPVTSVYDGAGTCAIMNSVYAGTTDCSYGCIAFGDCVSACRFGALQIDPETKLPVIDEDKCTACGICVKACPRHLIELRAKGPRGLRVWVACANRDRGAMAMKECKAACIGCGKCKKECQFEAITVEDNLAYIDYNKCRLCKKCVDTCPTKAIHSANFPVKRPAKTVEENKESTGA